MYKKDWVGRFIPTCVGSMQRPDDRSGGLAVHPHVCGEHSLVDAPDDGCKSVHPHVCGEHSEGGLDFLVDQRFIPTCVGSI